MGVTASICHKCGEEIESGIKTCSCCGTPIKRRKKSIFKKWWFWVIILLLTVGTCSTSSENVPTAETNSLSIETNPELVKTSLLALLEEHYDYANVEYDEQFGYTVSLGSNGLASNLILLKQAGFDENCEPWLEFKQVSLNTYSIICDGLERLGIKNPKTTLKIVNDLNTENSLLLIYNGMIVYDVMCN